MQNLFPLVGSRVPGAECRLPSTGREIAIETGPVTEPVLRLVGAKAINCYLIFFRTQTCLSVRFGSYHRSAISYRHAAAGLQPGSSISYGHRPANRERQSCQNMFIAVSKYVK